MMPSSTLDHQSRMDLLKAPPTLPFARELCQDDQSCFSNIRLWKGVDDASQSRNWLHHKDYETG